MDDAMQHLDEVLARLQKMAVHLALFLMWVCMLVPVASLTYAALTDQPYWRLFRSEGNLADWWSSLQLLVLAVLAWLNRRLRWELQLNGVLPPSRLARVWIPVAAAFLLFSIDERFGFHEFLRDALFRAHDLFTHSHYILPGDVGLYLFFFLGLAALPILLEELRETPRARFLLLSALAVTAPVIIIDSLRDGVMRQWWHWRFWDYFFEEQGEVVAELLFALAFLDLIHHRLGRWRAAARET